MTQVGTTSHINLIKGNLPRVLRRGSALGYYQATVCCFWSQISPELIQCCAGSYHYLLLNCCDVTSCTILTNTFPVTNHNQHTVNTAYMMGSLLLDICHRIRTLLDALQYTMHVVHLTMNKKLTLQFISSRYDHSKYQKPLINLNEYHCTTEALKCRQLEATLKLNQKHSNVFTLKLQLSTLESQTCQSLGFAVH